MASLGEPRPAAGSFRSTTRIESCDRNAHLGKAWLPCPAADFRNTEVMNPRIIAHVFAVLCVLSSGAEPGQIVGNVEVSEGLTPFIRFVHTRVDDAVSFTFAQFLIFPKTGSATRPIKVRYARFARFRK
jgi:hypothetical protein